MPTSTVTISGPQRQVFRAMLLDHLSGIGDVALAIEQEDYEAAERLGSDFREDLRLMADLGWEDEDLREADLTMPPAELAPLLRRLRADAEAGLAGSPAERESREEEERLRARYQYVLDTCDGLLVLLERERGDRNGGRS